LVEQLYRQEEHDYNMPPLVAVDEAGTPLGRIRDGDSVIFCCRRGEREIQLTRSFVDPDFSEHPVKPFKELTFVPMTLYHEDFSHLPVAFPPLEIKDTLGEVVSQHGLKQARIAESEKFAHVTHFFNGRSRGEFPGEVDVYIPSRKDVAPVDAPELRIEEVTQRTTDFLARGEHQLIVVNLANGDVIGHIDNRDANLHAAEVIDRCLGVLISSAQRNGYITTVTADHGVFEQMTTAQGKPSTAHTTNPVPFILVGEGYAPNQIKLRSGKLANVAPTLLEIMRLTKPKAMRCHSLIRRIAPVGERIDSHPNLMLLVILDGCGIGLRDESNPLFTASTPVLDHLNATCSLTRLKASGTAVGLLADKPGNSESGHMNIAAGRVVLQDDVRVERALKDGSWMRNPAFLHAIQAAQQNRGSLHLLALLSKKSSHGSMDYALQMLKLAQDRGMGRVFIHMIFDGRSTAPGSAPRLLVEFGMKMQRIGLGRIVTGIGRGYALDRDQNYQDRTRVAYEAMVYGKGREVNRWLA
jgi:2,3-bisphosphoglycerate-independent phosphoglycerate mutase